MKLRNNLLHALLFNTACSLVPNPNSEPSAGEEESTGPKGSSTGAKGDTTGSGVASATSTSTSEAGSTAASTMSETTSSTAEPRVWCRDLDGDGFGAPDDCITSVEQPLQRVNNSDDCDDSSPYTHPGAASMDDPESCMRDEDGDGWGDAHVDEVGQVTGGADCYDDNEGLNPGAMVLTTFLPYLVPGAPIESRTIATLDLEGHGDPFEFTTMIDLPMAGMEDAATIVSATLNDEGAITGSSNADNRLYHVSYGPCGVSSITRSPATYADDGVGGIICGLEWVRSSRDGENHLYGVDHHSDLVELDPVSGIIEHRWDIESDDPMVEIEISSCGMAFDCTNRRLVIANGNDQRIYSIDVADIADEQTTISATDEADLSSEIGDKSLPTGIEYDPLRRAFWVATGTAMNSALHEIDLGGPFGEPKIEFRGSFSEPVSNLQFLPRCR